MAAALALTMCVCVHLGIFCQLSHTHMQKFSSGYIVYDILLCYRLSKQSSDHVNVFQDSFEHKFSVSISYYAPRHPHTPHPFLSLCVEVRGRNG